MTHKVFSGLTLTVLGTLSLLQGLGVFYFGLTLWPAVLLWLGLEIVWGSLFDHWHGPSIIGTGLGLFLAGIGLTDILGNAGVPFLTAFELGRVFWPLMLVALGLSLLFRQRFLHWH